VNNDFDLGLLLVTGTREYKVYIKTQIHLQNNVSYKICRYVCVPFLF
jgi:hypothetical protein